MANILQLSPLRMAITNTRMIATFRSSPVSFYDPRKAILHRQIVTSIHLQSGSDAKMKGNDSTTLPGKDSLTFSNHHIAYKNMSNWELLRGVLVYKSLTFDYLVENSALVSIRTNMLHPAKCSIPNLNKLFVISLTIHNDVELHTNRSYTYGG